MTKLAEYCRAHRFAQRLTLGDLTRRIGATNVSKMANKLVRFEREGIIDPGLLNAVVTALGLDPVVVQTLMGEDEAESLRAWESWASEPIRPYLLEKPLPGVYMRTELPDEALSPADAEAFASSYAKQHRRLVCLIASRRHCIWYFEDGSLKRIEAKPVGNGRGEMIVPSMSLRGEKKKFVLDFHRVGLIRQAGCGKSYRCYDRAAQGGRGRI